MEAVLHEGGKEGRVAGELWPLFDDHADSVHSILTLNSNAGASSGGEPPCPDVLSAANCSSVETDKGVS